MRGLPGVASYLFALALATLLLIAVWLPAPTVAGETALGQPAAASGAVAPGEASGIAVERGPEEHQAEAKGSRPMASAPWVPTSEGRIVVGFHEGIAELERAESHRKAAARGERGALAFEAVGPGAHLVKVESTALEKALDAYRSDPRVRYAEVDQVRRALEVPDDPYFGNQWGLSKIQAPVAWEVTRGSSSVYVAILDTGIEESHPDLAGKVVDRRNFTSASDTLDRYGHGTHVAGIAAAATGNGAGVSGVGYDTRILNVKVLDDSGSGYDSWIANGIYWATDNGARVINLSLGAPGPMPALLQDAVNYAWSRDVVVVAAAGNNGTSQEYAPANGNNVLSMASTNSGDARSSFSNYGGWVDLAAPGEGIFSTYINSGYASMSGTSMATPLASGLAALLWSTGYGTGAQAVVDRMKSTADPIVGTGSLWQAGRLNAARAVAALATSTPTTTPTSVPTASSTPLPVSTPAAMPPPQPSPTAGTPVGSERLANGGFEGGLAGWYLPSWFGGVVGIDGSDVHSGSGALRFKGTASGPYVQQDVSASPGQRVSFSGWVNLSRLNGSTTMVVELVARHSANGDLQSFPMGSVSGVTSGWVQLSGSALMPERTAVVRLRVRFPRLNGVVHLDDMSLRTGGVNPAPSPTRTATPVSSQPTATPTPGPIIAPTDTPLPPSTPTVVSTPPQPSPTAGTPVGPERLANGGFEGGLAGWYLPSWFGGVVGIDGSEVHSGSGALRFKGTASGPYVQQDVSASPGQRVSFSGWVNLSRLNGSTTMVVELVARHSANGDLQIFPMGSLSSVTAGWIQLSGSALMPERTAVVRLRVRFPRLNGVVHLDDMSLTTSL